MKNQLLNTLTTLAGPNLKHPPAVADVLAKHERAAQLHGIRWTPPDLTQLPATEWDAALDEAVTDRARIEVGTALIRAGLLSKLDQHLTAAIRDNLGVYIKALKPTQHEQALRDATTAIPTTGDALDANAAIAGGWGNALTQALTSAHALIEVAKLYGDDIAAIIDGPHIPIAITADVAANLQTDDETSLIEEANQLVELWRKQHKAHALLAATRSPTFVVRIPVDHNEYENRQACWKNAGMVRNLGWADVSDYLKTAKA